MWVTKIGVASSISQGIIKARDEGINLVIIEVYYPLCEIERGVRKFIELNIKTVVIFPKVKGISFQKLFNVTASGLLSNSSDIDELIYSAKAVMKGGNYLSPHLIPGNFMLSKSRSSQEPFAALSKRELDVALMVINGEKPIVIASKLSISIKTVSTYKKRALEKLNLDNGVDLANFAFKNGIHLS